MAQTLTIQTQETAVYHLKPIVARAAKAIFPHATSASYRPHDRQWDIWGRLPGVERERVVGTVQVQFVA